MGAGSIEGAKDGLEVAMDKGQVNKGPTSSKETVGKEEGWRRGKGRGKGGGKVGREGRGKGGRKGGREGEEEGWERGRKGGVREGIDCLVSQGAFPMA